MTTGYLSPNRVKILIERFPEIQMTAQKVNIPGITLTPVHVPTPNNKDVWFPGDKIEFEDLIVTFIVDNKLSGYKAVKKWIKDISGLDKMRPEYFSDMTVEVLSNNFQLNQTIKYYYCFPYQIVGGIMDTTATEEVPITFDCMFKYSDMDIVDNT